MDLQRKVDVETMRAVVQDGYGEAEVLRPDTLPRPSPADGEVLLRVHAAGVDRGAWHLMTGLPYPVRLVGYGVRAPRTPVRGRELAGRVESVGAGVTAWRPGDEVFGIGEGCFAEFACARADRLAPMPAGLTPVQAAALPISGLTALQAVRAARVADGEAVLVIGASGGVGTLAVQLAVAAGAEVTAVCGPAKADLVRELGATHVVDYTQVEISGRFDAVLDFAGQRPLRLLRRVMAPRGRLVLGGSEAGGRWLGGLDRQLRAALLSPFVGQTLRSLLSSENGADLRILGELAESGRLVPVVDRTFELAATAEAMAYLTAGRARGKVVVVP
jgi:NADPH:quinone reductase-like Zn-dependent oxidoreductase